VPPDSLQVVNGRLGFSFSDPDAGLHCAGRDGGACLLFRAGATDLAQSAQLSESGGRFRALVAGFGEAELEPLAEPVEFEAAGTREWLCRLSGSGPGGGELTGFGAVTSASPLERPGLRRRLWACFDAELAFLLDSALSGRVGGHGEEEVAAVIARGQPPALAATDDPRLSSTYGSDGQLLRAGIELWEHGEDTGEEAGHDRYRALRLAGETIAAGSLGDGTAVAFLAWHFDGRLGIGAYVTETVR
jgi:hypothetical protein